MGQYSDDKHAEIIGAVVMFVFLIFLIGNLVRSRTQEEKPSTALLIVSLMAICLIVAMFIAYMEQ